MLTIGGAFYRLKKGLENVYDAEEAAAIAHEVLQEITGMSRLQRLSDKDVPLNSGQEARYTVLESMLLSGTPMQYALGYEIFLGRRFEVNGAVLIPRPETEELVQWITQEPAPHTILDIGTGSGCIAISLSLAFPGSEITGIDISNEALEVANRNAGALGASVTFREVDFLDQDARDGLPGFDIIVSNPPYIPAQERATLHTNVREFEPAAALFVPDEDPLLFYNAIAAFGITHLTDGGRIFCELHRDYAEETGHMFRDSGYTDVTLRKDLAGADRMLRAVK